jgi:hypothetical protein
MRTSSRKSFEITQTGFFGCKGTPDIKPGFQNPDFASAKDHRTKATASARIMAPIKPVKK